MEPKHKLAIGGLAVFSVLIFGAGYKLNRPADAKTNTSIPTEESTVAPTTSTPIPTVGNQLLLCKPVVTV